MMYVGQLPIKIIISCFFEVIIICCIYIKVNTMDDNDKIRKIIKTTVKEFLNEQILEKDSDLEILKNIAKQFDNPNDFDDFLNRNKLGHNRDYSFLGERFKRLNRGKRLIGDEIITIYRTDETQIKWGDYIYVNYNDAKQAYNAGQGNNIYKKNVKKSDIIETSVEGEFYYSPKNIAVIGEDLIDFWYYANNKTKPKEALKLNDDIRNRIKDFKKELKSLKGKFDDFDEYEKEAFRLSLKYKVPFEDYEEDF